MDKRGTERETRGRIGKNGKGVKEELKEVREEEEKEMVKEGKGNIRGRRLE